VGLIVSLCIRLAGLQAQLAGVQQVRGQSGDFAMLLSQGPSAVQELTGHLMALESTKKMLLHGSLKELIAQVAQLNDCHIVVVSIECCCGGWTGAEANEYM